MAARSVTVTFINASNSPLVRQSADLSHGEWDTEPPGQIPAGGAVSWKAESDGFLTGTEGEVNYTLTADPTATVHVHWDNPYAGTNSFDESAPAKFVCSHAGGDGEDAAVTWTFGLADGSPGDLDRTEWLHAAESWIVGSSEMYGWRSSTAPSQPQLDPGNGGSVYPPAFPWYVVGVNQNSDGKSGELGPEVPSTTASFLTHGPLDAEFIARCHGLGIRCLPYIQFFCGMAPSYLWNASSSPTIAWPATAWEGPPLQSPTYMGVAFDESHWEFDNGTPRPAGPWFVDGLGVGWQPPTASPVPGHLVCPNNVDYQNAMVAWAEHIMSLGASGLWIDCLEQRGACDSPHHEHLYASAPNDPSFASWTGDEGTGLQNWALAKLLERIKCVVHRHNGVLVGNTGVYHNSEPWMQWIQASLDGLNIEQFVTSAGSTTAPTGTRLATTEYEQPGSQQPIDVSWPQLVTSLAPWLANRRLKITGMSWLKAAAVDATGYDAAREDAFLAYGTAQILGAAWAAPRAYTGGRPTSSFIDLLQVQLGKPTGVVMAIGNGVIEPLPANPTSMFRVFEHGFIAITWSTVAAPMSVFDVVTKYVKQHAKVPAQITDLFNKRPIDASTKNTLSIGPVVPAGPTLPVSGQARIYLFDPQPAFGHGLATWPPNKSAHIYGYLLDSTDPAQHNWPGDVNGQPFAHTFASNDVFGVTQP